MEVKFSLMTKFHIYYALVMELMVFCTQPYTIPMGYIDLFTF